MDAKPKPVLRGPPQTWLTEGDSVTLSCEVTGSTTGWRFHWYKTAPFRPELLHVTHESRTYSVELLSDSIRGAGGSYTLSPAALRHTGVYVCRAERGEPAYHTEFSQPQPLWVTGLSTPSIVVSPNNKTHFTSQPLSLSCMDSGNSTGWRLRWFSGMMEREKCPYDWTNTGSSCRISSSSSLDSGVYWCQSESGEQSNPVNITVHYDSVILESPAHPVTEGDPLTLRCRYRYQPSNISADFYKDGTLLQTSTTGEMTIPAVLKSHESLYKCSNPERGESPESWITVKDPGPSKLEMVGVVVGIILILVAGTMILLIGQQQHNISQDQDQHICGGKEEDQQEYYTLHSDGADARLSDVTYATIDQQGTSENVKNRKKKEGHEAEAAIVYSELKTVNNAGEAGSWTQ
ncbi:hypothetical protein AALO_G00300750 [Alosa alosa]|uniref:Ig-like domain-containing protein n=1 Tax=Alosa alosa TaxID=278164 RepID=A0AAV6FEF7_9TELE|nr:hypothetical protein AALO_G00300750 [Alosa alosa]